MKGIDTLVQNPLIKKAFEKTLTGIFEKHNLKLVTISLENGEFKVEAYKTNMKVISVDELNKLTEKLLE